MKTRFFILFFVFIFNFYFISAQTIQLSDIEIETSDNWIMGEWNVITIRTLNLTGDFIDIDEINVKINEDLSYEDDIVIRFSEGTYGKRYNINNTNLTQISFNISVSQLQKTINKNIFVNLTELDIFDVKAGELEDKFNILFRVIVKYRWTVGLIIMLFIAFLILLEIVVHSDLIHKLRPK